MTSTSTPSQALLLRCSRCGQAFAEMLALIEHSCADRESKAPPKRRQRSRRPKAPGAGEGQP